MHLRLPLCLSIASGLNWLGTTPTLIAQEPVIVSAPGCPSGNCAAGGGNPASFAPNKHLPNGCKPYCATHTYPKFESLYIKKFCGPNLIPGSNYGYFPTTWRKWDDSATGGNCQGGVTDPQIITTPYGEPMMTIPQAPMPMTTPLPNPNPNPNPVPAPMPMPMPMSTTPTTPVPMPMPMPKIPKPKLESPEPLPGSTSAPATLPQVVPLIVPVIPVAPVAPIAPEKPLAIPGSTMAPETPTQTLPIGFPTSNSRPIPSIMNDPLQIKPWINTKPTTIYPPTRDR